MAVITVVPAFFAVIIPPLALTVATLELLLVYLTLYEAVPLGSELLKSKVSPTPTVSFVLLSEILLGAFLTVTTQVAFLPLCVVAVITAVPAFLAVIMPPLDLTVATLELLLVYFILYEAVSLGIVQLKSYCSPTPNVIFVLLSQTLPGAFLTVTLQVAVLPFDVFTVIFAVPVFLAVILPVEFTVATLVLLLDQV